MDIDETQAMLRQVLTAKGIMPQHIFSWEFWNGVCLTWDIDKAKEIAKGNKVYGNGPEPQDVADMLRMNASSSDIDDAYAMTRDLKEPIIIIASPYPTPEVQAAGQIAFQCIDGWHRLKKAQLIKHPDPLPVVVLEPEEERQCRIATTFGGHAPS